MKHALAATTEPKGLVVFIGSLGNSTLPIFVGWVPNTPGSVSLLFQLLQVAHPEELCIWATCNSTKAALDCFLYDVRRSRVGRIGSRWYTLSDEMDSFIDAHLAPDDLTEHKTGAAIEAQRLVWAAVAEGRQMVSAIENPAERGGVVRLVQPKARRSAKPHSSKSKGPTKASRPRAKTPAHAQGMAA